MITSGADTRIAIRWRDLDPLGHVNHEVFLTYLEHTRDAWLAVVSPDLGPEDYVIAHLEISYRAELTRDMVWVAGCCRLDATGSTSLTLIQELVTPTGVVAAEARVVLVLWDRDARRSRPISDAERAALTEAPAFVPPALAG